MVSCRLGPFVDFISVRLVLDREKFILIIMSRIICVLGKTMIYRYTF